MTAQQGGQPGDEAPRTRGKQRFAGLHGLVEAFRRLPAALRRPETLMLVMAILASFGAHMPPYMGLGALAEYWDEKEAEREAQKPVEVSYEWTEPSPPDEPEAEPEAEPTRREAKKEREQDKREAKKERVEPEPEKKQANLQLQPPPPPPPPPPPVHQRKQSISQKLPDPADEPPPEARFLAEQNSVVEEETVAEVRDEASDDAEPEAAAPQDLGVDMAGDARQDEKEVESFNDEGRDEGEKLVEQRERPPAPASEQTPTERHAPGREARAERAEVAPSTPAPGTVIKDPMGSFTLATVDDPRDRQRAQAARAGGRAGPRGSGPPNLAVSWRNFEDTFDADELARERIPQRRTRVGSSERKKRWGEYRAAVENYVVGVKPGRTTALNAVADPFAAYIAAFHRHLHMAFAYEFLQSLPATGEMADPNLMTKVEMVINPDGTLDRVGIVRSSGQTMFDFGAFNAVKEGEPYPRPPSSIYSADGKVYLRWALHRNHSQCGTWNAEPYIVKSPPDVGSGGPPGIELGPTRRGPG